ncbi:hyaluronidase-3 isoform X2 [Phyllostomus discolor]|uniref:Hyaluronidase n=1 Tax=Phyllostomus discolor TaxID=89673 RepID=A0A7E6E3Q9_9CHIR|nr:hyaluronidase-3 isoform X2 [Phyllostomus discolor]
MAGHLLPICTLFLASLGTAPGAGGPVVPNQPFATVWNANTQWCLETHGVDVDVSVFDVVANPGQTFLGPDVTIFYSSQLGTYPYYTSAGQPVFGGLPQNASLDAHLARTYGDILAAMPASNFSGLAVIDWEAWRPRWAFNWDAKDIYRQRSRELVQGQHPDWPAPWVEAAAQDQFQRAAQAWMAGTLKLGRALRPRGLWGFYGFPGCYNYDFLSPNYTGECPPGVRAQNDQLEWLWGQSRALYPSIYIPAALEGTGKAQAYMRHRVGEAFRVAVGARDPGLPVLPYAQIFYDMTNRFLPLEELEHSLGESAAQGAAGVVLWVSWENTKTKGAAQTDGGLRARGSEIRICAEPAPRASWSPASTCFHSWGVTMQLGAALVLGAALCLGCGHPLLRAPARPFSVLWNVPSARCGARFGVHLPLEALGLTANRAQRFRGQNITIFYKKQLGLYPYFGRRGTAHNGGIPQAVPLDHHLARAAYQIRHSLGTGFAGLAVLDWEEWSPLWAGNWGRHRAYRDASWAWAQRVFPHLDPQEQLRKARTGFEQAARALMEGTLRLGRALRPRGLWGFYRFPACGNGWHGAGSNYTGHCHAATRARNTQLRWLWAASSALFPSIYLPPRLPPAHRQAFVRHRLEEAFRVARAGHPQPLPVLAYARLTSRSSGRFLSQEKCWHLRDYLVGTLGPYVINVTRAATACSHQWCHGHGRCVRRDPGQLEAFLHLRPDGSPGAWESFRCRCYGGWAGPTCQEPRPKPGPEETA